MSRRGSPWMTALVSAPFVFGAGCTQKVDIGGMNTCGDRGVICGLDGGLSDAALPIGDAQYPAPNQEGLAHISENVEGLWHGVVAGVENIWPPFEMQFVRNADSTSGTFVVRCLDRGPCVPLPESGDYKIFYVDGDRAGQGEFSWMSTDQRLSARFRNLLLQRSDDVLFFVVDFPLVGTFQFVMQRGPWPDAGTPEPDASTSASDDSGVSADSGAVAP